MNTEWNNEKEMIQTETMACTNGQDIAEAIRKGIEQGRYSLGDKLKEVELCREFGVSRTPVREAFRLLQNEGLLEYIPQRGVRIRQFNEQDMMNVQQVRAALEQISAYNAAPFITYAEIAELRLLNEQILDYHADDPEHTNQLDFAFHMLIARSGGNNVVPEMLERLNTYNTLYRYAVPFRSQRVPRTYKEHEDIISALEQHDAELARRYMEIHFINSQRSIEEKSRQYREEHPDE